MIKRIFYLVVLSLIATNVFAQSITITGPVSNVTVKEGDNYFTDVLNDPMDFDKRRDIQWEQDFAEPITVSNGVWSGTTNGSAAVYALFQGAHGANATQPQSAAIGKRGVNFPLDTRKYTSFSVISSLSSQAARSIKAIAWTNGFADPSFGDTTLKLTWDDSFSTNTIAIINHGSNEFVLDILDMSTNSAWTDNAITGIMYDQSPGAGVGVVEKYKMFRVFDPNSSPTQTISWSYSGLPPYAGGSYYPPKVSVYLDDNNSGFDGAFLARVPVYNDSGSTDLSNGTGSFTFPTAALAPGEYYFYLKLTDNVESDTLISTSVYSAKLTVNSKARLTFENPSYTSGNDFATTEIGNPWDFNDAADITNLVYDDKDARKQIKNYTFTGGYFQGTAFMPPTDPPQTETEAQLWLNTSFPIKTSKYKYLTYQIDLDPTGYTNIADKLGRGWMVRISWYNVGFTQDGSLTNDILLYEGANSYSLDLSTVSLEHEETGVPNPGWAAIPQATFLRLDPCEVSQDTVFRLWDVKLTANPEPDYTTDTFEIAFTLNDNEGETAAVDFYRDNDKSGYNGTFIGSGSFTPGSNNTYSFSTASLPLGDYYIYAVVTDSFGNVFNQYADVPMTVSTAASSVRRVPYYRLYNPNSGEHFYTENHREYVYLETVGWAQEKISYYIYNDPKTIGSVETSTWYRLYNPNDGFHHWTLSQGEYDYLGSIGWTKEGLAGYFFYSNVTGSVPLYRVYNPNSGMHHWTMDSNEKNYLVGLGWNDEGIAGYVFNSLD